jgi:DNA-binding beta-propeller fold protein YncE
MWSSLTELVLNYFANVNSNTVSVINTSSNAVIATISVYIFLSGISITLNG